MDTETKTNEIAGIEERRCESWSQFKLSIYEDLFCDEPDDLEPGQYESSNDRYEPSNNRYQPGKFVRGKFIFRGHGSSKWELKPTFDRWFSGPPKSKPKIANELLEYFRRECEVQEDLTTEVMNNRHQILGIAQHHGLPTRLLDWTENPYIAAFFAFSSLLSKKKEHRDQDVAVWVIDTKRTIWSSHFGVEIIEVPPTSNYRMYYQTAKFTNLTTDLYGTLEELVNHYVTAVQTPEPDNAVLFKYLIPAQETEYALADLALMGINYSRIFPDREGYALAAKMAIVLEHSEHEYGW